MANSHARNRMALLAAAVLLLGVGTSLTDFWAPDEPRYGQIAEEIRSFEHGAGGLVLLHLGGEPYTQKPPLYYWLAALAGAPSGRVTETAARLPSILGGIATVMLCFAFAGRLFRGPAPNLVPGASAALLSGAFLLTSFRFAHLARRAQLDVLLTLFETLALFAFWQIETTASSDRRRSKSLVALLHAALGAAALTKGPVGWTPLLVIAIYLAWDRRIGELRRLVPAWALLLSVAPVVLWILGATALAPSGFFSEAVVANLWDRFFSAASHVRPAYYYLYQLPADFMPWTLLLPFAGWFIWRTTRDEGQLARPWRLLLLWVAVPLVIFSLASGKRGLYLLPAFPALALMLGGALEGWIRSRGDLPRLLRAALMLAAVVMAAGAGGIALAGGIESADYPGFGISRTAAAMGSGVLLVGIAAGVLLRRAGSATAPVPVSIATVLALELLVFTVVYPAHDAEKSPRPVALEAAALTEPDESVGIFDDAGLAGGILYYGDRRVEILPRPEQVADFLERGGRFIVLERWKLPWLDTVGRFQVHATTRRDVRQLAIVSLEDDSQKSR